MFTSRTLYVSLVLFLALVVGACGASSMQKPELKKNPNPKQRYQVTMTIKDAPGAFDSINGYAIYQVLNDVCVPLQPGSGARLAPYMRIPVTLTRNGDLYVGAIYADQMLDEDYYGLGVCKWTLTIAAVELKARTNTFRAHLNIDDKNVISQKPKTVYFGSSVYTDSKIENFDYNGEDKPEAFKQFSVETTMKESSR
jgi:hypothetical protein